MAETTFTPAKQNHTGHILSQFLLSFLIWPAFWYGAGLKHLLWRLGQARQELWRDLSMKIFLASFFKPMFGLTDIWSRLISFGARGYLLMVKLGRIFFWLLYATIQIIIYLILPPLALYWLIRNLI